MKKLIKLLFEKLGYVIGKPVAHNGKYNFQIDELNYDLVRPAANYSPWFGDAAFMQVYDQVKDFTLVDIYRCYELWQLTGQIRGGALLEVGLWKGGTAGIFAKKLMQSVMQDLL